MSLPQGMRPIGDDCFELSLPGRADGAAEIAWLEGAAAVALDRRRHLLLNFEGRSHVDPGLVETIGAERARFSEVRLDLREFGATGVARQVLRNLRSNRTEKHATARRSPRRPAPLPWPARAQ